MDMIWKPHPYLLAYEVSEYGHVRRLTDGGNRKAGQFAKGSIRKGKGHILYHLMHEGEKWPTQAHVLVLETFVGPPPTKKHQGAHNDGNPANNHVSNLRWATAAENQGDVRIHGTRKGSKHGRALLTENNILFIRAASKEANVSNLELASAFGVTPSAISSIIKKRTWTHV